MYMYVPQVVHVCSTNTSNSTEGCSVVRKGAGQDIQFLYSQLTKVAQDHQIYSMCQSPEIKFIWLVVPVRHRLNTTVRNFFFDAYGTCISCF